MAETSIWMPMYWADYLADTQHLSTEEHGAYILLIATYWRRGCALPDDDKFLASVVKANRQRWAHLRKTIGPLFEIVEGSWKHKRIEKEILKSTERLKSARANGRAGGLAKSKLITITTTVTEEESKKEESKIVRFPQAEAPPKPLRKSRSSIPDNFPDEIAETAALQFWGVHARFDLTDSLPNQVAQFRDHHLKTGATMADWPAAWRTWYRNSLKFNKQEHLNGNGKRSSTDQHLAGIASLINDIDTGRRR